MTFPDLVVEFAPGVGPFDRIAYLALSGTGAGAVTVDDAAFNPDDKMEAVAHVAPASWATASTQVVIAKWNTTSNQRSWAFGIDPTGAPFASFSADGSTTTTYTAEDNLADLDALEERHLRWVLLAVGTEFWVEFMESLNGEAWRYLGPSVSSTGATLTPFDSSANVTIGATANNADPFEGRVYSTRVSIGAVDDWGDEGNTTAATDPDFRPQVAGDTSFVDDAGRTWLVGGPGSIVDLTTWVDVSDYTLSAVWRDGKETEYDAYPPGEATVILKNDDRRFDPDNSAGPYFGTLDPRTPFRIRSTDDGGSTYAEHFYGFVEGGFEQTYGHPEVGECTVRLTDLLGVIAGFELPSVLDREVTVNRPFAYWPLTDEGSETASDLSGRNLAGTYRNEPALTNVDGGLAFDEPARTFGGLTLRQAVDLPNGARLPLDRPLYWFSLIKSSSTPDGDDYFTIYNAGGDSHQIDIIRWNLDGDGRPTFEFVANGGGSTVATDTLSGVNDGTAHAVAGVLYVSRDTTAGSLEYSQYMSVDGLYYDLAQTAQASNDKSAVVIGGHPDPGNDQDYFDGQISHVALFDTRLVNRQQAAIYTAARAPLAGLRSDQQIAWALDYVGVPDTLRDLDEGRAVMGNAATKGRDALEFIRQVVETEQGAFYVDHSGGGKLRFSERYRHFLAPRSTTSQATFSDDSSATTAVRVEPDALVVRPNGIDSVINQISVTWHGGSEIVEDTASVRRWGPRGRSVNAQAATAHQAIGLAQYLLALGTAPHTSIEGLGLDPGAAQGGFEVARDLRIDDLITYRSQPQSTGSVTTRSLLVLGSTHAVERGRSWLSSWRVSASPAERGLTLFTLDTSELDGPDVLGF